MSESLIPEGSLLAECQRVLDYTFRNPALLKSALTHASGADHRLSSNERLEFLGDAILGAVVCEVLFHEFPESLEGALTRIKSVVVSRRTCARVSRKLGFDSFLVLGKGMGSADQTPDSVLADVFESLVGAIYLDGGLPAASRFILEHLGPEIAEVAADQGGQNYKSLLQQSAQRQFGETPTYLMLDEKGPDHSKCFKMAAQIGSRQFSAAWGPNKKDAEQHAARNALSELAGEAPPFVAD
ncbi:MAG TPA: ribonuclease III [Isosphaeraceae bacterium]|nr:ribonuclease III [Isosphaeraceae bacterium]